MRTLLTLVVTMTAMFGSAATRPAAVAGAFYPGTKASLEREVRALLEGAPVNAVGDPVRALVVPHAGFVYSGATAAGAFAGLAGRAIKRVVVLGPSHHASFAGGALPAKELTAFATPLGDVHLDVEAIASLRQASELAGPTSAHDREHCLEVELPFLQVLAPEAKLVPILIGQHTDRATARAVARRLAPLLDDRTVVVVSTDFSHHGQAYGWSPFAHDGRLGDRLLDLARATGERVAAVDPTGFWQQVEVSGDTVCGKRPVAVLGELLEHAFAGRGEVLGVTTSGHVSGSFEQSVSYVAVRFTGAWQGWQEAAPAQLGTLSDGERAAVVSLARAAFASHLEHDASLARWFAAHPLSANLRAPAGAFVTVHNTGAKAATEGRLRACMGVIEAREPLVDAVVHAAQSAAHDPRFPPLTAAELAAATLEVSVLSPTRRAASAADIEVGTHGVVLAKGGRSAVFLPQVAPEQGWDRDTMLTYLARKAGLPGDGWRQGASFDLFTAQVVAEPE